MRKLTNRHRKHFFPFKTSSGVECVPVSSKVMRQFLEKNFTAVFGKPRGAHYQSPSQALKTLKPLRAAYAELHHEYFLFKKGKTIIGWSFGEMDDFETFYMRNTGLLPDYRSAGTYSEFLEQFLKYLKTLGYQRVSSHHQPDNTAVIKVKMKAGFVIVGNEIHDRWGYLIKLVRILDPNREAFFKKKFF